MLLKFTFLRINFVNTGRPGKGIAKSFALLLIGIFCMQTMSAQLVDYLVVAGGGGGGGDAAGGGGGGGILSATNYNISGLTPINITVGAGGIAGVGGNAVMATNGSNSSFGSITTLGGGYGGTYNGNPGNSGGSGGGGAYSGGTGGAGTMGQGSNGGTGNGAGGGGGGAGEAGLNGNNGGVGGSGVASLISGTNTYYGGGGGGGRFNVGAEGINNVGLGGGGHGAGSCASNPAVAGTVNTGGGGGGSPAGCQTQGAAGGSGIVIVRYLGSPMATGGTITQSGGYTIHTFTGNGTFEVNSILPVDFISLNGEVKSNAVAVSWKVSEERNIANYEVERSADGRLFTSIGNVAASGSSQYNFMDSHPLSATSYYRIKSAATTGGIKYSTIIKLQFGKSSPVVSIYPNPVRDQLGISLTNAGGRLYELRILNIHGTEVTRRSRIVFNTTTLNLDVSILAAGSYMLEITSSNGEKTVNKFIKN